MMVDFYKFLLNMIIPIPSANNGLRGRVIALCAFTGGALCLFTLVLANYRAPQNSSVPPDWAPPGYKIWPDNSSIAFRERSPDERQCDDNYNPNLKCTEVEIVAKNGCRNLYVEWKEVEVQGQTITNLGFANATTSNLTALETAVLVGSSYFPSEVYRPIVHMLSEINCS